MNPLRKALDALGVLALAAIIVMGTNLLAQSAKSSALVSYGSIKYPPIARVAHIEGDVTITFTIDDHGVPADITYKSGPVMLQATATDAVRTWRFDAPNDPSVKNKSLETVFHFRIDPPQDGYNEVGATKTTVELHSANDVSVIGIATTGLDRDKCPSSLERQPPTQTALPILLNYLAVDAWVPVPITRFGSIGMEGFPGMEEHLFP